MASDDDDLAKTFDFSEVDDPGPTAQAAQKGPPVPGARLGSNVGLLVVGAVVAGFGMAAVGLLAVGFGLWFRSQDAVQSQIASAGEPVPVAQVHPSGCPLGKKGSIGWVRTDTMKIRKGDVSTLPRPTALVTTKGGSKVVCTLPGGTSIYAVHSTRTNVKGAWLQVYGTAVTVPE